MSRSRYFNSLFFRQKKQKNVSSVELKNKLIQLDGNWQNFLDLIPANKDLLFYLKYYVAKGLYCIPIVSCDDNINLAAHENLTFRVKKPIITHKRKILENVNIDPFYGELYLTAIHANCMIYLAKDVDSLITLHATTLAHFKCALHQVNEYTEDAKERKYVKNYPFPPIFLVITDENSPLNNKEIIEKLPFPVLHSVLSTNITLDPHHHIDLQFLENLLQNIVAPSYEMLSELYDLIPNAFLCLADTCGESDQESDQENENLANIYDEPFIVKNNNTCIFASDDDTFSTDNEADEDAKPAFRPATL